MECNLKNKSKKDSLKRLVIRLPKGLHDRFMRAVKGEGTSATFIIRRNVEDYCKVSGDK